MPGVLVRDARSVDVPAMTRTVAAAFGPFRARTGIVPAPLLADYATIVSAMGARIALRDGRVVGVLVLWPHPDHLLVETIAVAPADQGAGVGTLLLELADREAIAAGLREVRLYTNAAMADALAFYPRRGFRETGRRCENGFERVFFAKRLGRP